MVRKMRYRQVLQERCKNFGKGIYAQQVRMQQSFFKEDKSPNLTIPQVREIHSSIGTWDNSTWWAFYTHPITRENRNFITVRGDQGFKVIYPKANYKPIKEARWKEQARRTEEFFEREGC